MMWDRMEANRKQVRGRVRERWGWLTDNHLEIIAGRRDRLVGRLQELYGEAREAVERQIHKFERRFIVPFR